MLCEICKKNEAVVHITKVVNGKVTSLNLCSKCAKENKNIDLSPSISFNDFLKGIINITEKDINDIKRKTKVKYKDLKCDNCGTTYEELLENGTVGCSKCYKVFSQDILDILRRTYGNIKYESVEHKKSQESIEKENLRMLKLKLKKAVENEDFDLAAKLRDMIKKVENEKKRK